jgi:hypothetical protein
LLLAWKKAPELLGYMIESGASVFFCYAVVILPKPVSAAGAVSGITE